MKTAIVYYSLSGNTDYAAKRMASLIPADTIRLYPVKAYPDKGFTRFFRGGKSAVFGEAPALEPYKFNAAEYDTVIIGMPVWAGRVTPPLRTFINENKQELQGKRVFVFVCCSGGTNGAKRAAVSVYDMIGIHAACSEPLILIDPKEKPSDENDRRMAFFCSKMTA